MTTQNNGVYSTVKIGNQYNKWNTDTGAISETIKLNSTSTILNQNVHIDSSGNSNVTPSIKKRTIRVPLKFFFTKNIGLALPMLNLINSEVKVRLKLRPYTDLYTIIETDNANTAFLGSRIKPTTRTGDDNSDGIDDFDHHNLTNFILSENFNDTKLHLNLRLDIEHILLTSEERTRFINYNKEYLIEKTKIPLITNNISASSIDIDMFSLRPVKYFVLIMQRSDAPLRNDWNNYTNWIYEDVAPYSYAYTKLETYSDSTNTSVAPNSALINNKFFYQYNTANTFTFKVDGTALQRDQFKNQYFKKNIVEAIELKMNGLNRFKATDCKYFENVQTNQYFKKVGKGGVYLYSFSINPSEFQPSGVCDFVRLNDVKLRLTLNPPPHAGNSDREPYYFTSKIFIVEYNVLKIENGYGTLGYEE